MIRIVQEGSIFRLVKKAVLGFMGGIGDAFGVGGAYAAYLRGMVSV